MESNREPLSLYEYLELSKSLSRDTVHQSELVQWKHDNIGRSQTIRDPKDPKLRENSHVKFD
jgi:hypothetical protein